MLCLLFIEIFEGKRAMRKNLSLKCFSPPVMIATFAVEIFLAIYVAWRYKLNQVTRLAVTVLVCLAIFQLAEFNICEGSFGIDGLSWARVGYAAITALPPLGFHLATKLAGKNRRAAVVSAYATGAAFAGFFVFSSWGISSQACLGNYVIFRSEPNVTLAYAIYYYGWLILGTLYSFFEAAQSGDRNRAAALRALAIGYLSFILPTTTANVLDSSTIAGIPSIMCGFAVILALILSGEVLPKFYKKRALTSLLGRGKSVRNIQQKHVV